MLSTSLIVAISGLGTIANSVQINVALKRGESINGGNDSTGDLGGLLDSDFKMRGGAFLFGGHFNPPNKSRSLHWQEGHTKGEDHEGPQQGYKRVAHDVAGLQSAAGTYDRQEGQCPEWLDHVGPAVAIAYGH